MNPHLHTPTLSVIDPRALAIRSVGYCRHPDEFVIEPRITRQMFDRAGRLVASWDPRLWGTAPRPNLSSVYGLSGQPVLTESVDAGWQLSVLNHTGSLNWFWDGRGSQRGCVYDDQQRPVAVTEQNLGGLPCVVDRFTYGGADAVDAERNQCGRLIRHDNPASSQIIKEYGLAGAVLVESISCLIELETPDWPLDPDARDEWLEDEVFTTRHSLHPTGEMECLTDAMGNVRTFGYDVSGKLNEAWLLLAGEGKPSQRLVFDIRYNALDQIESETAGNGVVTRADYAADDGRLIRLVAAVGSQTPLQDLNYVYDAVGNIVELEDKSQPVSHFNNQRIDPINRYRYDSLYQLIEASGWEVASPSHGPALPELLPTPLDPNQRRNYTQRFDYDAGGNLITRHHSGAPGFSMFTSARSNRSLAQRDDGSLPGETDIDFGIDACGNHIELQRGQAMHWDARNQLSRVTLVKRKAEPDDYEGYAYDLPGHRLRKVHVSQTLRAEVRYLPGLEIHRQPDGEEHHVITTEAGRSSVRALHWPDGARANQLRYSFVDHLRSSTLELDEEAGLLTREHYSPFGHTTCWAGKSELLAKYKTIRYSGKERDATGLYYYGYRYYAPWLQRWINPDPAGSVDGPNLFIFVINNPKRFADVNGLVRGGEDPSTNSLLSAVHYGSKADRAFTKFRTFHDPKEKFRQLGKVIINRNNELKSLSGYVVSADVSTPLNRSFFWSGDSLDANANVEKSAMMTAQYLAKNNNGLTIEMTPGGELLENYGKANWPAFSGGRSTPGFKYLLDRFRYIPSEIRESLLAKGSLQFGKNIHGVIGLNFFDSNARGPSMLGSPLKSVAGIVWDVVSIRFAREATGTVNVIHAATSNNPYFQSDRFLRSTWLTKEKVALIHEAKTTIFERFGEDLQAWELQGPRRQPTP